MQQTADDARRARRLGLGRDAALALALGALGAGAPSVALSWARPALVNFGPNDGDYVRGFRQDWERDGRTRFHWTSPAANVLLPLHVEGEGAVLRLRYRRHFIEPAQVRLLVEGRTVAAFAARAGERSPYTTLEVELPRLEGRHPLVLSIEAGSEVSRPLGLALDWIEVDRRGRARFSYARALLGRTGLLAGAAFVLLRLAGGTPLVAAGYALATIAASGVGARLDPVAFERIVREGGLAYLAVVGLAVALVASARGRRWLGLERRDALAGGLVLSVAAGLAVRLALLLHPGFFYPDVRVHGAFSLLLARRGLLDFSGAFIENQFLLSLGLQQVGAHWYAFPYPPGFYLLASPLIALGGYRPEVAVSVLAAAANALAAAPVFAIARALGLDARAALASAAFVPLLPLFLVRLSLGYFPALAGQLADALVLAFLARHHRRLDAPRAIAGLAALLAVAFLTYTQAILNFALLFVSLAGADLLAERPARPALRRGLGLAAGALLGGAIAFGTFYVRYVPMLEALREGRPVAEERLLRDRLEREDRARAAAGEAVEPEDADPYTGPTFEPLRGVRKAGWRLFVFYSWFAPVVLAAFVALARAVPRSAARFVWPWGLLYLWLNLLSGSLPGPNIVRYNKDLESVAALACVALGAGLWRLLDSPRPWRRVLAALGALAWIAFAATRGIQAFAATFVLER